MPAGCRDHHESDKHVPGVKALECGDGWRRFGGRRLTGKRRGQRDIPCRRRRPGMDARGIGRQEQAAGPVIEA